MGGQEHYAPPVDMWAVGVIFAEMITRRPLFPGDSEIDELYRIFRVLGTPNESVWPGVSKLPDYSITFPNWRARDFKQIIGKSLSYSCTLTEANDPSGQDLLEKLLKYDPVERICAKDALNHPYFDDLDTSIFD